jgi:hypothetical protein
MKKIGEYTLKGTIPGNTQEKIHLFDGSFATGYVVKTFQIITKDTTGTDGVMSLFSQEQSPLVNPASNQDFGNNSWIATAFSQINFNNSGNLESIIDPDNLIIEDLYLTSSGQPMNYLITMEKYDISAARGALAMVRNNQQNVE